MTATTASVPLAHTGARRAGLDRGPARRRPGLPAPHHEVRRQRAAPDVIARRTGTDTPGIPTDTVPPTGSGGTR